MGKKYLEDEEEYEWDDGYEWDDRYDELDASDEFEEEIKVNKTKTSSKSSKSTAAATKSSKSKSGSSKNSSSKSKSSSGKKTGKKMSAKKKRRRRAVIVSIIFEVLLLAVICVGLFVIKQFNNIQAPSSDVKFGADGDVKVNELPFDTLEQMKGYTTYAVFGLDKRNMEQLDDGLSDVILLVSVNDDTGEINMVSIYRDTYLQIDSAGNFGKINSAYNKGGAVQAIEALNTNLDLQIDHYVTVNWYAVAQTIDLLGGVDMEISEEVFYAKEPNWGGTWLNSYIEQTAAATGLTVTYPAGPGYQTLTGLQAVALCRIRQVGMDFARTDTQRQVIAQVFEKAKKAKVATLIDISKSVFPNIQTDMDLSDISKLLPSITKYYMNESAGFPSSRGGKTMTDSAGNSLGDCIITKDLLTNVAELHQILYKNDKYAPSDTVINISEMISRATGIYAD